MPQNFSAKKTFANDPTSELLNVRQFSRSNLSVGEDRHEEDWNVQGFCLRRFGLQANWQQ